MGTAKLFAPEGATSCSFDGAEYVVKDGVVEVPAQAVSALLSHGYATSREAAKPPEPMGADLGKQLTASKLDAAELRGVVEPLKAERDAAVKRVKELEVELAAAKEKKR